MRYTNRCLPLPLAIAELVQLTVVFRTTDMLFLALLWAAKVCFVKMKLIKNFINEINY